MRSLPLDILPHRNEQRTRVRRRPTTSATANLEESGCFKIGSMLSLSKFQAFQNSSISLKERNHQQSQTYLQVPLSPSTILVIAQPLRSISLLQDERREEERKRFYVQFGEFQGPRHNTTQFKNETYKTLNRNSNRRRPGLKVWDVLLVCFGVFLLPPVACQYVLTASNIQCKLFMALADANRDSYMNSGDEYIAWLKRITGSNDFPATFEELPTPLQALYTDYALADNGQLDLDGARGPETPNTANLVSMCETVEAALAASSESSAATTATNTMQPSTSTSVPLGTVGPTNAVSTTAPGDGSVASLPPTSGNLVTQNPLGTQPPGTATPTSSSSADIALPISGETSAPPGNTTTTNPTTASSPTSTLATLDPTVAASTMAPVNGSTATSPPSAATITLAPNNTTQSPSLSTSQTSIDTSTPSTTDGLTFLPEIGNQTMLPSAGGTASASAAPLTPATDVPRTSTAICKATMFLVDQDRDSRLNTTEYVSFVVRITSTAAIMSDWATASTLDDLPQPLQDAFNSFAAGNEINIFGANPMETASEAEDLTLGNICAAIDEAIHVARTTTGVSAANETSRPSTSRPTPAMSVSHTQDQSLCKIRMAGADAENDGFLNSTEYVVFLNFLTTNRYSGLSLGALPLPLQENFRSNANVTTNQIPIYGASPEQGKVASAEQIAFLDSFCNQTEMSLQETADPSSTPPSSPDFQATASPLANFHVLTIHSSFFLSNTQGYNAQDFNDLSNPNRQDIEEAYTVFIETLVPQALVSSVATSNPATTPAGATLPIETLRPTNALSTTSPLDEGILASPDPVATLPANNATDSTSPSVSQTSNSTMLPATNEPSSLPTTINQTVLPSSTPQPTVSTTISSSTAAPITGSLMPSTQQPFPQQTAKPIINVSDVTSSPTVLATSLAPNNGTQSPLLSESNSSTLEAASSGPTFLPITGNQTSSTTQPSTPSTGAPGTAVPPVTSQSTAVATAAATTSLPVAGTLSAATQLPTTEQTVKTGEFPVVDGQLRRFLRGYRRHIQEVSTASPVAITPTNSGTALLSPIISTSNPSPVNEAAAATTGAAAISSVDQTTYPNMTQTASPTAGQSGSATTMPSIATIDSATVSTVTSDSQAPAANSTTLPGSVMPILSASTNSQAAQTDTTRPATVTVSSASPSTASPSSSENSSSGTTNPTPQGPIVVSQTVASTTVLPRTQNPATIAPMGSSLSGAPRVAFIADSAKIVSVEDKSCDGVTDTDFAICQVVFAVYSVSVSDDATEDSVYNYLVASTQEAIEKGQLMDALKAVNPSSEVSVEGASFPPYVASIVPTQSPTTTSPSDEGGSSSAEQQTYLGMPLAGFVAILVVLSCLTCLGCAFAGYVIYNLRKDKSASKDGPTKDASDGVDDSHNDEYEAPKLNGDNVFQITATDNSNALFHNGNDSDSSGSDEVKPSDKDAAKAEFGFEVYSPGDEFQVDIEEDSSESSDNEDDSNVDNAEFVNDSTEKTSQEFVNNDNFKTGNAQNDFFTNESDTGFFQGDSDGWGVAAKNSSEANGEDGFGFEVEESDEESVFDEESEEDEQEDESFFEEEDDDAESEDSYDSQRERYREEIEALVQEAAPHEMENIEMMMQQFEGREDELLETLKIMHASKSDEDDDDVESASESEDEMSSQVDDAESYLEEEESQYSGGGYEDEESYGDEYSQEGSRAAYDDDDVDASYDSEEYLSSDYSR